MVSLMRCQCYNPNKSVFRGTKRMEVFYLYGILVIKKNELIAFIKKLCVRGKKTAHEEEMKKNKSSDPRFEDFSRGH